MHEQSNIPTVRNLDGVYYRVVRDGNHVSRCFSDLSESEQDVIMEVSAPPALYCCPIKALRTDSVDDTKVCAGREPPSG